MDALVEENLHQLPANEVLRLLRTDAEKGLDILEVRARQARFGPNAIPAATGPGPFMRFLLQFHTPLVYILLAAAAITAALHEWVDSGVIFGVVLLNAIVGFLQESSAAKALAALARTTLTETSVLRAGEVQRISSTELVPGDIVLLQSGDKDPADLRLFYCRDLQIDESVLTGESVPVNMQTEAVAADVPLAERRNMAFTSTLVTYGQARGVVCATGANTEVGHISKLMSTADVLETPLTRKIAKFSRLLLIVILSLAGATFLVGWSRGQPAFDMFMAAVALAVGAIPEGLPAAVTITLSIGVARMARRRAIIRKLPAVETLGSTTVICSDKTGTLTVNQMTVTEILAGEAVYSVAGSGYSPTGEITPLNADSPPLADNIAAQECLLAGLCNDSSLTEKAGRWEVSGDPTEGALIAAAAKGGFDHKEWSARRLPRVDVIPFESQHQYMATLHQVDTSDRRKLYVKGAAEVVLARSVAMLDARGRKVPLDVSQVQSQLESLATKGLRVLVLASADLPGDVKSITHADVKELTFLGLQGMMIPRVQRPSPLSAPAKRRAFA
jgi:Ca2+-transporting ATPase